MTSDFFRGQIESLLNEAAEALRATDWATVKRRAQAILAIDPENADAKGLLAVAERGIGQASAPGPEQASTALPASSQPPQPTSFVFPEHFLANLLELSLHLEDTAAVERLLGLLRERNLTLESIKLLDVRPIFRIMGDASAVLGHSEEARSFYDQNLALCERIGHRPELALTRAHLAELLLDHYPEERDAAIEHLDFAIREFQDMNLQPSLERALRHRELLKA